MATCTQSMQRTWWPVASTIIVTGSYWTNEFELELDCWLTMRGIFQSGCFTAQRVRGPPLEWRHNEHDGVTNLAPRLFTEPFVQVQIKENIKAPRHWRLWGEFTGDRWIPRTNGLWYGKFFHVMTSSCRGTYIIIYCVSCAHIHPLIHINFRLGRCPCPILWGW